VEVELFQSPTADVLCVRIPNQNHLFGWGFFKLDRPRQQKQDLRRIDIPIVRARVTQ